MTLLGYKPAFFAGVSPWKDSRHVALEKGDNNLAHTAATGIHPLAAPKLPLPSPVLATNLPLITHRSSLLSPHLL